MENGELLLRDLRARIGDVKVDGGAFGVCTLIGLERHVGILDCHGHRTELGYPKPYLRSLDDMTEDEKDDLSDAICNIIDSQQYLNAEFYNVEMAKATTIEIDWLIAHHFDFRGLIGLDLAIRVTPENNPYK